jgi:hypothetical protein
MDGSMSTLQQKIIENFLDQLGNKEGVSSERIDKLRSLLSKEKAPKADDFVKAFNGKRLAKAPYKSGGFDGRMRLT